MLRRPGSAAWAVGFALLLMVTCPAHAGKREAAKNSLDQVQGRIEALKQQVERTEGAHAEAADALKKSERAISDSNRKLFTLNQQERAQSDALEALRQQKSGLESTIAKQQDLLRQLLYHQYVSGHQAFWQLLLSWQDPAAKSRELHYLGYVARARADLIAALRSNLGHVASLNDQTAAMLKEIAALKLQQEQQRAELQKQQQEHRALVAKLATQLQAQQGEISKLKRDEKRLTDLVKRLSRPVAPAPKTRPAPTPTAPRRETSPAPSPQPPSQFESLKGKLHLPVHGEVVRRFGAPREDTGLSWKGVFIRSNEGEMVKALADGQVVFADWMRGFGNLLIVDHGGGYMTLYGNNQALLKNVGEAVRPGDALATVGNSGGNAESGLYFELRFQGRPLDPLSWSALK